jgi:hypothetical protein
MYTIYWHIFKFYYPNQLDVYHILAYTISLHVSFLCNSSGIKVLPDDNVHTSKHVGAVEWSNKISELCICWKFVNTQ